MENRYNALSSLSVGSRDQIVLLVKKTMTMYTKADVRPTYKTYVNVISHSKGQETLAMRCSF